MVENVLSLTLCIFSFSIITEEYLKLEVNNLCILEYKSTTNQRVIGACRFQNIICKGNISVGIETAKT